MTATRSGTGVGQSHVFIGGLHRSGTTFLAGLIGTNPDVGGFLHTGAPMDEGQHLQTVCPNDEHHGGVGRFAYHPEAHMTETSPYTRPAQVSRLTAQWARYWNTSRRVLVDKSPPNMLRFRYLQAAFPGSRFVLVIRHPIPVAMSTRRWAAAMSVRELVAHWIHAYDIAVADLAALESWLLVRYEDLVARPRDTLATVADYLQIPPTFDTGRPDPAMNASYLIEWAETDPDPLTDLEPGINRHGYRLTRPG